MKLPIQVEAIIYQRPDDFDDDRTLFLALHRVPDRGGFWQPLTGGVEDSDGYDMTDSNPFVCDDSNPNEIAAVVREIGEETSIPSSRIRKITRLPYVFSFTDDHGTVLTEKTFGVEIASNANPVLSDEHDAYQWGNKVETSALFKWEENRLALDALVEALATNKTM